MAREIEGRVAAALRDFVSAPEGAPYDLENPDGKRVIELKTGLQGVRDLDAAVLGLSKVLADQRGIHQAYLVVDLPRVTDDRLRAEWDSLHRVVRPDVMRRLTLIAVGRESPWVSRDEPVARRIATVADAVLRPARLVRVEERSAPQPSRRFFEVFKLLLNGWLLRSGPVSTRYLMERTGFSYPTIADALRRLRQSGEIEGGRKRSVVLRAFPRQTWSELLVLSRSIRGTQLFADGTGRRPDPVDLLRRLRKAKPYGLALGGIVAARHWDPRFDLNGLPRLDVCVSRDDQALLRVGLVPAKGPSTSPVLASHLVERADPLFVPDPKGALPYADPVETLLDLHELRLVDQADQLIERLRARHTR